MIPYFMSASRRSRLNEQAYPKGLGNTSTKPGSSSGGVGGPCGTAAVKEATGARGKTLFMPLRMMITGQAHGPDMATLAPMIGRERIVKRLSGETA